VNNYRVYMMNADGRIVRGDWLQADAHAEAERLASALRDGPTTTVELWLGDHRIAVLPPDERLDEDKAAI
jgi:hypothetical protein